MLPQKPFLTSAVEVLLMVRTPQTPVLFRNHISGGSGKLNPCGAVESVCTDLRGGQAKVTLKSGGGGGGVCLLAPDSPSLMDFPSGLSPCTPTLLE